ncbi:MAG: DUF559 domain-containing protein [bacterium]
MTIIYNKVSQKLKRKILRNNATKAESILWVKLKNKQLNYKFRRQYSVGPYVLDFYCPKLKLAIEIDDSSHLERQEYDQERQEYIGILGIKFLRFTNKDVYDKLGEVVKIIKKKLALTPPVVLPLVRGGQGA